MTQRTCNIICICKEISNKYNSKSIRRNIAAYMANECGVNSVDDYTDTQIDSFIENAFLDFIDNSSNPSYYVKKTLCDVHFDGSQLSQLNKIMMMFKLVRVKEDDKFVNGFTQSLIDKMKIDLDCDINI